VNLVIEVVDDPCLLFRCEFGEPRGYGVVVRHALSFVEGARRAPLLLFVAVGDAARAPEVGT
jgi:hypothetical protein